MMRTRSGFQKEFKNLLLKQRLDLHVSLTHVRLLVELYPLL